MSALCVYIYVEKRLSQNFGATSFGVNGEESSNESASLINLFSFSE